jgi:hypothetical protein
LNISKKSVLSEKKFLVLGESEIVTFTAVNFSRFLKTQPEMNFSLAHLSSLVRDLDLEIFSEYTRYFSAEDLSNPVDRSLIPKMMEISENYIIDLLDCSFPIPSYGATLLRSLF